MCNENRAFLGPETLELPGPLDRKGCGGSRSTGAEQRAGLAVEQEQAVEVWWALGAFPLCQPVLLHLHRDAGGPLAPWH